MNARKTNWFTRYGIGIALITGVTVLTAGAVRRWHRPGQLDVITAQAMDMSQMRPPVGDAPVELASVRRGGLGDTVTYTGTVQAYNTRDISSRITGQILALPVYPGDTVRAGQLLAQLDTAEIQAKTEQMNAEAGATDATRRIAEQTDREHHPAVLAQAVAQVAAADAGVRDALAGVEAAEAGAGDARAAIQGARANADYWKVELAREKSLADAGAASRQEYQNEVAQARVADATLASALAKERQAGAMVGAATAKLSQAREQIASARAARRMAATDLALAGKQAEQARFTATASRAAARQAAISEGYARIVSPTVGVVTERAVAPGTLVQPGTVLLKIAEIDRVRVQARVAVSDLSGIRPGTPVRIVPQAGVNGAAKSIVGTVTSVFPAANETSRTAVVETVLDNPRHALLPGAFVTVHLTKPGSRDALLVPTAAVVYDGGNAFVWVASGSVRPSVTGKSTGTDATRYECAVCHMIYSAADARKHHFIDPMDGGKLAPVARAGAASDGEGTASVGDSGLTIRRVAVTLGASDGSASVISTLALGAGDRIVIRGQAGLTEGGRVALTRWGDSGPETLPTAAGGTARGITRYRCATCNMIYSEADARKHHFIDPMDGGKLTPVQEGR